MENPRVFGVISIVLLGLLLFATGSCALDGFTKQEIILRRGHDKITGKDAIDAAVGYTFFGILLIVVIVYVFKKLIIDDE
jgi:hypothetical protein